MNDTPRSEPLTPECGYECPFSEVAHLNGTTDHPFERAARQPAADTSDHACDYPGCAGQCHTGSTCPCHPEPAADTSGLRAALDKVIATIDDPTRYIEVNEHYRAGWVDALSALRDDPALSGATPEATAPDQREAHGEMCACDRCAKEYTTEATAPGLDACHRDCDMCRTLDGMEADDAQGSLTSRAIHDATDDAGLPCDGDHSRGWGSCQLIAARLTEQQGSGSAHVAPVEEGPQREALVVDPVNEPARQLPTVHEVCDRLWTEHTVHACPGSIVCGGYLPHDCATPGCMEPAFGWHGAECLGYLIGCPTSD